MCKWTKIRDEEGEIVFDKLPDIDRFVLFRWENGGVFHEYIDKDHDVKSLRSFLGGRKYTGPVVAWMDIPEYDE